ncbi:MAG: 6-carboxytetrahydropterin synthase [Clostridium sp.]
MENYYKFKFYINAKHSVDFGKGQSNIHPHTWEVVLYVMGKKERVVNFTSFEKTIQKYLEELEGLYLNQLEIFKDKEPIMENIGLELNSAIKKITEKNDLILEQLEISENPTRTYIIKN